MLKHYVEIYYPGCFCSESSIKEIDSHDTPYFKLPENAYAYRFFDKEVIEQNGEMLMGKAKNYSGTYYQGTAYTLDEVKLQMPQEQILISNMEINKWDCIVKTKFGQCFPIKDNDIVEQI